MEKLKIEGTAKTPQIDLDNQSGKVVLGGRSIPENALDFYKPIYKWLDDYSLAPCSETVVDVKLEYFNTSSSKCILQILKKLEILNREKRSNVIINWFHEEDDEDMQEAGEDFDVIVEMPFNIIPIEDYNQ